MEFTAEPGRGVRFVRKEAILMGVEGEGGGWQRHLLEVMLRLSIVEWWE